VKAHTEALLSKAERAIAASQTLLKHGDPDFAAGRAYYAMFYVAEALLHEQGLDFSKHGAVHAAFGQRFAKTGALHPKFHRWLLDAFDERIEGDYGVEIVTDEEEVQLTIQRAQELLRTARKYLLGGAAAAGAGDEAATR